MRRKTPVMNLGAYLDRRWLGPNHLWASAQGIWDPEGMLSTLPAVATTMTGILCSWWVKGGRGPWRTWLILVIVGAGLVAAGSCLNAYFPINKSLWTSTYVLLSSGFGLLVFSLGYVYADIQNLRFGTKPFMILGSNAILVFFGSTYLAVWLDRWQAAPGVSVAEWVYRSFFLPISAAQELDSLLFSLAYVFLWLVIATIFFRRKWFIRL